MAVTIDELVLGDGPQAWESLGFSVSGGCVELGRVRLRLAGTGGGITGWALRGSAGTQLDGLPTAVSERPLPAAAAPPQANGVLAIDHVVAMTGDLDRTAAVLQGAGLDLRRVREEPTPAGAPRQAFFRLGEVVLEVIQIPDEALARAGGSKAPARFWGIALTVADIDALAARLGDDVGSVRPAVQEGRRIATLRRSAGLGVPVALMSEQERAGVAA